MSINIVFLYYKNRISEAVHRAEAEDRSQPICGTAYALDDADGDPSGEFIHSNDLGEATLAARAGVSLYKVTCKKCLKKLAKEEHDHVSTAG